MGGRHLPEVWQLAASLTFHFPQGEVVCTEGQPAGRSRWAGMEQQGPANPQACCCPESLRFCAPSGPVSALTLPTWLFADPDVVSLEAADRPNFFLHVTANGSVELAKWQGNVAFHHHASFSLHRGTWQAGLVALESLAEPGSFLYVLGPTLVLRLYEHTEVFRRGTFFRLLGRCPPCHHPQPLIRLPFPPSRTTPFQSPSRGRIPTLLAQGDHPWVLPLRWDVAQPPC